jgi:hypothetical protein
MFFRLGDQWNHHTIGTYYHTGWAVGISFTIQCIPTWTNQTFITNFKCSLTFILDYLPQPVGTDANLGQTLQVLR